MLSVQCEPGLVTVLDLQFTYRGNSPQLCMHREELRTPDLGGSEHCGASSGVCIQFCGQPCGGTLRQDLQQLHCPTGRARRDPISDWITSGSFTGEGSGASREAGKLYYSMARGHASGAQRACTGSKALTREYP